MKPLTRRFSAPTVALAVAILAVACSERTTPTEPASFVAPTPTPPAPAPTVVPGQPASLQGSVRSYGPLEAMVECQGKSTAIATDGTFSLPGLLSGPSTVTVTYSYRTTSGATYSDYENFTVVLQPGANTQTFTVY